MQKNITTSKWKKTRTQSLRQRLRRFVVESLEQRIVLDAQLVRDVNTTPTFSDSSPAEFAEVGGNLFFVANDGISGRELWITDGTEAGTVRVKDISPGASSSEPRYLTNVDGTLFFSANDGTSGHELWKSDGTDAGTIRVKDIDPGASSSLPNHLVNVNGTLFFSANDGTFSNELWKSDGTEVGTVLVKDIRPGGSSYYHGSYPGSLTNLGGVLYFSATDGTNGDELWKSDGTEAGTVLVKDIRGGSSYYWGSYPSNLTIVGETLFFSANDGTSGDELWKTDGTEGGTVRVKDIRSGTDDSYLRSLANVGGTLFFSADDGTGGRELWKSDGTETGTVLVKDIRPGGGSSLPPNPSNVGSVTNLGGTLFFSANDGTSGYELWKSDGTEEGTLLVTDIASGITSSGVRSLTSVGATLFFSANDGTSGDELWKSDGTEAGTVRVMDIRLGADGSSPASLVNMGGTLFFSANDGNNGDELWKTNGTEDGTFQVKDISPPIGTNSSHPGSLTNVGGTLFFSAIDETSGRELWKSDGTETGTVRVKDISPGIGNSFPSYLTNVGGTLFFSAIDGTSDRELWKSDGTDAGTVRVKDISPGIGNSFPRYLTNVGGTLFFSANDGTSGYELWKSDGTDLGTSRVKDISPGGSGNSFPRYLTNVGGTLFFSANDGTSGRELWKSDGTESGTVRVKDIYPGDSSSSIRYLVNLGGTLFFRADDGTGGTELWKSDGTEAGTVRVKDIRPGSSGSFPSSLTVLDGTLFFGANDGTSGDELWKSDGTEAGTIRVKDIRPGLRNSSSPRYMTDVGGTLFFRANDGTGGIELWKSDGTEAGTVRVKDIEPGSAGSSPLSLTNVGGTLFFSSHDSAGGRELWKSDGSEAGTVLVQDIRPGTESSYPAFLTDLGGTLFFNANDGIVGSELWLYSPFQAAENPDLYVDSLAAPATSQLGEQVTVSWGVANVGSLEASQPWRDQIFLSSDAEWDPSDLPLLSDAIAPPAGTLPLAVGGNYSQSISLQIPLSDSITLGSNFLIAVTDRFSEIDEIDESNNIRSVPITLTVPPLPDLVVSSIAVPVDGVSGRTIQYSWTVTNQGTAIATGTWVDSVWVSADNQIGGDIHIGDFSFTGSLLPGESITRTQSYTLPIAMEGEHWIVVHTDANNQVFEHSNRLNNTSISNSPVLVQLAPFPNLQVTSVISPSTAFSGQQAVVEWVVSNVGNGPTSSPFWRDAVYLNSSPTLTGAAFLGDSPNQSFLNVGDSYVNSRTVFLPQGIGGTYYFIIVTDHRNDVYEFTNENDNAANSSAVTVQLTPPPDLQVTQVQAPANAFSGQPVTLTWTVTNQGAGDTLRTGWSDRLYLSTDTTLDAGDTPLGTVTRQGSLPSAESYTSAATVTLPVGISGTFYFIVHTDFSNQVYEHGFENNNTRPTQNPTQVFLTPPPDLEVESVSPPTSVRSGTPLAVDYRVANNGSSVTPNSSWDDELWISNDQTFDPNSDLLVASRTHVNALHPGQHYDATLTGTVPTTVAGAYYVFLRTDALNSVFEVDKVNNISVATGPVNIDSRPADLVVTSTALPETAVAGSSFLASWTVANQGVGDTITGAWFDQLILSTDQTIGNSDDLVLATVSRQGRLDPGTSYTVDNRLIAVPFSASSGSYSLFVVTDSTNQVHEGDNDDNNASTATETSILRQLPDLQVTSLAFPATGQSGNRLEVSWEVTNFGQANTNVNVWHDDVYLSSNPQIDSGDLPLGRVQRTNVLSSLQKYSRTTSFDLPIDLHGEFYVIVRTDATNAVIEGDGEQNNERVSNSTTAITLSPVPDLAVTTVSTPATAFSGHSLDVSWTVQNVGGATAGPLSWYDAIYLSLDQTFDRNSDVYLGFRNRPHQLQPGEQYARTERFTIPRGLTGPFYVFVATDGGDRVYERLSEANNAKSTQQVVQLNLMPPADLVLGTITIPENAAAGQNITVTYSVHNQGAEAASGNWTDAIYISADQNWNIDDRLLGRVQLVNHSLESGGSYTRSLTAPLPGFLPGEYFVIVRSDIRNQIAESNLSNNIGVSLDEIAIDFAAIELSVPVSGTLDRYQSVYYRVEVPAGETLSVFLNSAATEGFNELYVAYGRVPTRNNYDLAAIKPFEVDQRVVVPTTKAGTYYILAYGSSEITGQNDYDLSAELVQFSVFDTSYGRGATAGDRTLEINGAKFDRTATVILQSNGGFTIVATKIWFESSEKLFATFDLREAPVGVYDVSVIKESEGAAITIQNGFTVVNEPAGDLFLDVSAPDAIIRPRPGLFEDRNSYGFSVAWANNSLNDLPIPVLSLLSSDEFGSSMEEIIDGKGESSKTFYAVPISPGPPGVLMPGAYGVLHLVTRNSPVANIEDIHYSLSNLFPNPSEPIDWVSVSRDFSVPLNSQQIGVLEDRYGSQVSGFMNLLAESAALIPATGILPVGNMFRLMLDRIMSDVSTSISGVVEQSDSISTVGRALYATHLESGSVFSATILTDNSFTFSSLFPGRYSLQADRAIVLNDIPDGLVVEDQQQIRDLRLRIDKGGNIRLTLANIDVTPENAATVLIFPTGMTTPELIVEIDTPTAVIEGIEPGMVDVLVYSTGMSAKFHREVLIDDTEERVLELSLQQEGLIRGSVLGPDGASVTVRFVPQSEQLPPDGFEQVLYNPDFIQGNLPAGRYDLVCESSGYLPHIVEGIVLGIGETVDLGDIEANWTPGSRPSGIGIPSPIKPDVPLCRPFVKIPERIPPEPDTCESCRSTQILYRSAVAEINASIDELDKLSLKWSEECEKCQLEWYGVGRRKGISASDWMQTCLSRPVPADILSRAAQLETQIKNATTAAHAFLVRLSECHSTRCAKRCLGDACQSTRHVGSFDPNDILGPDGVGEERWLKSSQLLNYTIRFENDPILASAPAQLVRITQQLDSDLDFRTFRLGDFSLGTEVIDVPDGRSFYVGRIDFLESLGVFVDVTAGIDVISGEAFWEFRSIDPATGELPDNPLVGLLPPNIVSPQGEGFATYSIRPKSNTSTGTVIDAEARIIFDLNEPIDTPPIFNTLDAGRPTSQVIELPELLGEPIFLVRWVGEDDENGSGLASFTIYVSTDNGPYTAWLTDTTLTEALYVGEPGRHYAFYSVGRDNVGNVEAAPLLPDAETLVFGGLATIGDRVWLDSNANGVQDDDEVGMAGVLVRLYREGTEAPLLEATTTSNGHYSFIDVDASASYFIELVAPAGYGFTAADMGEDEERDSDVDVGSGRTTVFSLSRGINPQWDAGLVQLAVVSGKVWWDVTGDGSQEGFEPNLADQVVFIDTNDNGALDTEELRAVTDASRAFSFGLLRPGAYTIRYIVQEGWEQTYPGNAGASSMAMTASSVQLFAPGITSFPGVAPGTLAERLDVDGDGGVTVMDVQQVKIALSTHAASRSPNENPAAYLVGFDFPADVSGDGLVTPLDVLLVVNAVNSRIGEELSAVSINGGASAMQSLSGGQGRAARLNSGASQAGNLVGLKDLRSDNRFAGLDGSGLSVVIIDTGIDLDHAFFGPDTNGDGVADRIVYQYDFAEGDANASDRSGHGSHVSSVIASSNSDYPGIAPGADIISLKVFSDAGYGSFAHLEQALQWVISNVETYNIAAINMSLGDGKNWSAPVGLYGISDELSALEALGVITVSAAGNSFAPFRGEQGLAYPAADPNSLSVGAVWDGDRGFQTFGVYGSDYTTGADRLISFSQRDASHLDTLAPGAMITAANATGGVATMRGTSMAAPFVAGAAVLAQQTALEQLGKRLTTTQMRTLLAQSGVVAFDGDDEDTNIRSTGAEFRRLDLVRLIEAVAKLETDDPVDDGAGDNEAEDGDIVIAGGSGAYRIDLLSGQDRSDINFGTRIINDTDAPRIRASAIAGSGWPSAFRNLVSGGDGAGLKLLVGAAPLPFDDMDRLYLQFSEGMLNIEASHIELRDSNGVIPFTLAYDVSSYLATLEFSSPLSAGKYRLSASAAITDLVGNALDGDGDGVAGGVYSIRFDVLPADTDGNQRVGTSDLLPFGAAFNAQIGQPNYNLRSDWNADGRVNTGDLGLLPEYFNRRIDNLSEPGESFGSGPSNTSVSYSSQDLNAQDTSNARSRLNYTAASAREYDIVFEQFGAEDDVELLLRS